MSGGFSNPIIGGGGSLVYPSIHSPNFVHNVSGWSINKTGSAEFNNLTIRGTFFGVDFILNSTGLFFYSGTPALGNLILSVTNADGTDIFGNSYGGGFWEYDRVASNITAQLFQGAVLFTDPAFTPQNKARVNLGAVGAATQEITMDSGNVSTDKHATISAISSATPQILMALNSVSILNLLAAGSSLNSPLTVIGQLNAAGLLVSPSTSARIEASDGGIAFGKPSSAPAAVTNFGIFYIDANGNAVLTFPQPSGQSLFVPGFNVPSTTGAHVGIDGSGNLYLASGTSVYTILAADASGFAHMTLPSGLIQRISGASPDDSATFTVTQSTATVCSKAWTINANDAEAETEYVFEMQCFGQQGTTQESLTIHWQLDGGAVSNITLPAGLAVASGKFVAKVRLTIHVTASGVSGAYWHTIEAIAGQGGGTLPASNLGGNNSTPSGVIDTTVAHTVAFAASWANSTVGCTLTSVLSKMRRIG